jgi:hypothetical protein
MKIGDICIVKDTDRTTQHPAGSRVKIVLIAPEGYGDDKPYYCQSEDGRTCYWYGKESLEVVEREGLV